MRKKLKKGDKKTLFNPHFLPTGPPTHVPGPQNFGGPPARKKCAPEARILEFFFKFLTHFDKKIKEKCNKK